MEVEGMEVVGVEEELGWPGEWRRTTRAAAAGAVVEGWRRRGRAGVCLRLRLGQVGARQGKVWEGARERAEGPALQVLVPRD